MKLKHQSVENSFQGFHGRRAFLSSLAAFGTLHVLQGQALPGTDSTGNGCAVPTFPEPWSRFRGPNGSGMGRGTGYPVEFGPNKNVVWKRPFPMGKSSPILTTDRMSEALPVVSTEVGGCSLLIENGVNGWTVPVGRPDSLGEALRPLILDAGLRARMGKASRARVAAFSVQAMVAKTEAVYESAIQSRAAASIHRATEPRGSA